jgi:voltage-gated potassium channel
VARRRPWWIGWRLVALVIVGVHAAGTLGYVLIEGWSAWDAFYMTVITVTTVGYGEVHPLSQAGRVFTVWILLSGVGAFFYAFTLLMTLLADGGLVERLERRRVRRMLDQLHEHFIVCCIGRMGDSITTEYSTTPDR